MGQGIGIPCTLRPGYKHLGTRPEECACARRQFFLNGKVLPIERGRGTSQAIMGVAADLVRRGDWLHVFPEGRVEHTGRLGPVRHGVGKLICDAVKDGGRCFRV